MKSFEQVVANAIRVEKEMATGKLYLVFEIVDENLRKQIEEDWTKDIELKLIGKKLCLK